MTHGLNGLILTTVSEIASHSKESLIKSCILDKIQQRHHDNSEAIPMWNRLPGVQVLSALTTVGNVQLSLHVHHGGPTDFNRLCVCVSVCLCVCPVFVFCL